MATPRSIRVLAARLHHRRQSWANHTQSRERQLLMVVEKGSVQVELGTGTAVVKAGCGCWCPAGTARSLISPGGVERHFNLGFCGEGPLARGPVAQPTLRSGLWALLPLLHRLRDPEVHQDDQRSRALIAVIAADFLAAPSMDAGGGPGLEPHQREHLERWVTEHLVDGVTPGDIARQLGFTADYATRCFRASYGVSPRRWLRDERIRRAAADLIDERLSITEASTRYGFTDASFFCRQFRTVMGCSPGAWRRREIPAEVARG